MTDNINPSEKKPKKIKKSKRKQNIISILIIFFGTLASWLILGPKEKEEAPLENPAVLVGAMSVDGGAMKIAKVEKTATWEAGNMSAQAVSEFSGRIRSVDFKVGDKVSKGQTLAVFDQSSLENPPKVALQSAERSYELAKENLSDTKDLNQKNVKLAERDVKVAKIQEEQVEDSPTSTSEEKDLAEQAVKIAKDREDQARKTAEIQKNTVQIQLEQARLTLDQARTNYENTLIKSPIAGTVVSKKINNQDYLNPGDEVAEIVGEGKLEAVIYLNKDEIGRVREGDSVQIKVNDEIYPGRIASFSEIANEDNERFEVRIITDSELTQKANRTGSVILNVSLESGQGFFVPLDAVNIGQNKKEVFVVEAEKAKAKRVGLGKIIGTQIEVLSGLEAGEMLIVENSRNLTNGQAVRLK